MSAARIQVRGSAVGAAARTNWVRAGAALFGAAWGSNQFTPMLLVYRQQLGLSTGTLEALFGVYALGLIPGLLIAGPLSDSRGRRPVIVASAALSLAGTLSLVVADHSLAPLFVGRFLTGLGSGAAFGAGTAWLRELSRPPFGDAGDHTAARRAAVTMTIGFAVGPLVAGVLAQWAPDPSVVPYLPHALLMLGVLALVSGAPETVVRGGGAGTIGRALPSLRQPRFYKVVAPMAPWVFAAPAVAFALLPSVVVATHATDGIALTAVVATVTAMAGVLIQPVARRLDAQAAGNRAATLGLAVVVAGLVLSAFTVHEHRTWLLVPSAIVLGMGYGLCLVAGLVEVQRLAHPEALAGLTAIYYVLTYIGFAVPFVLALAAHLTGYATLLLVTAGLALVTAVWVRLQARAPTPA
ncbi:MAG TPA: MFS transporter [Solirubrobacteraceae bacterium]